MTNTTDSNEPLNPKRKAQKKRATRGATIIHVAFGPGGGRIDAAAARANMHVPAKPDEPPAPGVREPVTDLFTTRDVAKLLGLSAARLRTLDHAQIVSPTGSRNGRR